MNTAVIWITIAVYIAVMVIVAILSSRSAKTLSDLTVGGRSAGAWLSALSYGTAYFSAVMFVGYAGGTGWQFGLWGILAGLGNAVFGSLLAWLVLARRTRDVSKRMNIMTMPQFFERRYQSRNMKVFAAVVTFVFLIPYSASVYNGLASVCEVLLKIDANVCKIIIALLAMILLFLGGYMAQAKADFFQGLVMMGGVALLIFFVVRANQVGGLEGILEFAKGRLAVNGEAVNGLPALSGTQWVSLFATVLMTSFGTWGLPQMIQKYYGLKDDREAKRGIVISTFFAVLVAGGGYFIGSLSHMFFGSRLPGEGYLMGAHQDYIIPEMLRLANMPVILLGIVIVLLISASVSTLCSITLTASSTASMDLIGGRFGRLGAKENTPTVTKILCVLFVIGSYIIANTDTPILDMMSYSWGIISGAFLAPYMLALYYKGLNRAGAWAGMISGFIVGFVPALCRIVMLCAGDGVPAAGSALQSVYSISKQGPTWACAAMLLSLLVCVVVSAAVNRVKGRPDTSFFYSGEVGAE